MKTECMEKREFFREISRKDYRLGLNCRSSLHARSIAPVEGVTVGEYEKELAFRFDSERPLHWTPHSFCDALQGESRRTRGEHAKTEIVPILGLL